MIDDKMYSRSDNSFTAFICRLVAADNVLVQRIIGALPFVFRGRETQDITRAHAEPLVLPR